MALGFGRGNLRVEPRDGLRALVDLTGRGLRVVQQIGPALRDGVGGVVDSLRQGAGGVEHVLAHRRIRRVGGQRREGVEQRTDGRAEPGARRIVEQRFHRGQALIVLLRGR